MTKAIISSTQLSFVLPLILALVSTLVSTATSARPNVILMVADDLGWADTGYHGSRIETPSLDRLAQEGMRLERFYTAPICSPTRAGLMTGVDPIKLGIAYDQIHPWYNAGLSNKQVLIPEVFKSAGYQTGMVGKWHLGHSQQHQLPNAQGFDEFFGHLHTNTDFYGHTREGGHDLQRNGVSVFADGEYLTHLEGREAQRFITERDKAKPFFLYVPFTAPHSPMQAPQQTVDKYKDLPMKDFRRIYAAMVDEMDQAIGGILNTLESEQILDNTLVMFISDNGGSHYFGGHNVPLRGQKGMTFEGGIRVPALVSWPQKLEGGTINNDVISYLDVLPTLAAAAELSLPENLQLDGRNSWPVMTGEQALPQREPLFFVSEIPVPGMIWTAVIDGSWKLVQVVREGQTQTQVHSFLFNLEDDPNETNNLIAGNSEKAQALTELIRQRRSEHPLAGIRGTLVPHPGWVAPKDWAASVVSSELLQNEWKNELPFSQQLIQSIGDRGVLVDKETQEELLQQELAKKRLLGDG